jgi:hypothetical protein
METTMHPFEKAGLGKAPFRFAGMTKHSYQACPGAPVQPGGSCDYCGTGIMYEYWVSGVDGSNFKVGCDCIIKLSWNDSLEKEVRTAVRQRKKASAAERKELARIERKRLREEASKAVAAEQLARHPELAAALALSDKCPILADMKARMDQFGALTDRQIAFALKLAAQLQAPPEPKAEVVAGRRALKGTVLGFKTVSSQYGDVTKMIFRTEDGQKVFGTVPRELFRQARELDIPGGDGQNKLRGAQVEFVATVEVSDTDPFFGFFSRPTKAKVLQPAAA